MKFYDRQKEFKTLGKIKNNFRIAIIGRRRIGKTRLVEEFYGKKCITFFVPAEKAEKEIISSWVKEYPELHLPNVITFKDFFEFVFFHLKDYTIFIDELQNLQKVNISFLFDLQRLIDKYKPKLVVSGSIINVMKKLIEKYKSPLYGRFDYIIKLNELSFKTIVNVCIDQKLDFETAIKLYSIFGGIPKYYELIEKTEKFEFEEFVIDSFVLYPRPLYEEVHTMLREEFGKEYKTFFSILNAISQGNNKNSEIAGYLGKKNTEITKYLSLLKNDFEFINRKTPLKSKRGIYIIKNNIILSWFNLIWKHCDLLETLQEERAKEIILSELHLHISKSFERIILELVCKQILFSEFNFSRVLNQWGKIKNGEKGKNTYEIDILGINKKDKLILFGECKWKNKVDAVQIAKNLIKKTQYLDLDITDYKQTFTIIAKSFSRKTIDIEGKNIICLDLCDLEKIILKD